MASHLELVRVASPPSIPLEMTADMRQFVGMMSRRQNIAEPSDEWKDIVYHKYNDDRTSYECVPCYNSVDEYIASEKEDLESYNADLEEALEELKDMRADWKPEKEPNMDEEIELIKKWVKEREDFINE
jgi:hypothetical protein